MNGINPSFLDQFKGLPTEPVMSLRGGDAIDEYREAPEYDPTIDRLSPEAIIYLIFWVIRFRKSATQTRWRLITFYQI